MNRRWPLYLMSFSVGIGIGLLGERHGRTLDRTALLGLFGILALAFLIGHVQRSAWMGAGTQLPALTATTLVSLVITTVAFIAYVVEFQILGRPASFPMTKTLPKTEESTHGHAQRLG